MLTLPRALPPNGHIAVCAISGPSSIERVRLGAARLEQRGYRVTIADNVDHNFRGYLAGEDDERVEKLNFYLRSDDVDAILFSRGGYGAMRVLDRIDYDAIRRNPRPIVGFSDLTALHNAVAVRANVATFHGPMLNLDFHDGLTADAEQWFFDMLAGAAPLTHRFERVQIVSEGEAEGVLFGGCLSLIASLAGTPYDYWVDDGIWFWEDVGEEPYRLDRMLTHLDLSGRLRRIRGVLIGKLKGCGSEPEVATLLHEKFGSRGIPVVRDLPFGHFGNNLLMPIGAPVRVSTSDGAFTITAPAVQR
jgi:muramoyltetrapeptide carboxypeptidase